MTDAFKETTIAICFLFFCKFLCHAYCEPRDPRNSANTRKALEATSLNQTFMCRMPLRKRKEKKLISSLRTFLRNIIDMHRTEMNTAFSTQST